MKKSVSVIFPAAGASRRFRDPSGKKPFVALAGKPVWLQTLLRFSSRPEIKELILVLAPEDIEQFERENGSELKLLNVRIVEGGKERVDSVSNGLNVVSTGIDMVAVHDIARPCIDSDRITAVFEAASEHGAAILAVPVFGTVKRASLGKIEETVSRENLWEAQTPQVFETFLLKTAYDKRGDILPTDDAQLVERLNHPVILVPGNRFNIKITTKEDLELAEAIFRTRIYFNREGAKNAKC